MPIWRHLCGKEKGLLIYVNKPDDSSINLHILLILLVMYDLLGNLSNVYLLSYVSNI